MAVSDAIITHLFTVCPIPLPVPGTGVPILLIPSPRARYLDAVFHPGTCA